MSKIKFRIWDIELKRFVDSMLNFLINPNGELYVFKDNKLTFFYQDFFIISRYTGLQDRKGKDIYEGDILKNIHNDKLTRVEWIGSYAGFVHEYVDKSINKYKHPHNLHLCYMKMEVVGNIYENRELLEIKTEY